MKLEPIYISSKLDAIAEKLEAHGLLKEAARIDTVSNTIEAGPFGLALQPGHSTEELRHQIEQDVRSKPGYQANKVQITKRDSAGRVLKTTEGRVYTSEKPTEFSQLWKEGPDGNWYLQNSRGEFDVTFIGDAGYLVDQNGQEHPVPELKEVTGL